MKFGQLVEHNMRNIFVEKSYTKCAVETIPTQLTKTSKLRNLWIISVRFKEFVSIAY